MCTRKRTGTGGFIKSSGCFGRSPTRQEPRASQAALCAAEAATTVAVVENKQELIAAAKRALKHAKAVLMQELLPHFEQDIRQASELGSMVADDAPAPSEMFNVVHRQAIHEAGHAVAAALLGSTLR